MKNSKFFKILIIVFAIFLNFSLSKLIYKEIKDHRIKEIIIIQTPLVKFKSSSIPCLIEEEIEENFYGKDIELNKCDAYRLKIEEINEQVLKILNTSQLEFIKKNRLRFSEEYGELSVYNKVKRLLKDK